MIFIGYRGHLSNKTFCYCFGPETHCPYMVVVIQPGWHDNYDPPLSRGGWTHVIVHHSCGAISNRIHIIIFTR